MAGTIDERAILWAVYFGLRSLPDPTPARAAVEVELRRELGLSDPSPPPGGRRLWRVK